MESQEIPINEWIDSDFGTLNNTHWYKFRPSVDRYYLWWNDVVEGDGKKSGEIQVSAYYEDGTAIFCDSTEGWKTPKYFTSKSSSLDVYIKVFRKGGNIPYTYGIAYGNNKLRPSTSDQAKYYGVYEGNISFTGVPGTNALSATLDSNSIVSGIPEAGGSPIEITNVEVGTDNIGFVDGVGVGTWAYVYAWGMKIGIVFDFFIAAGPLQGIILGKDQFEYYVQNSWATYSGFGIPYDTLDFGDTYKAALLTKKD